MYSYLLLLWPQLFEQLGAGKGPLLDVLQERYGSGRSAFLIRLKELAAASSTPEAFACEALFQADASVIASLPFQEPGIDVQDPSRRRATAIGLGWRDVQGGVATATIVPAIRSFGTTEDDGLRNSVLEVGRLSVYFAPHRLGISQLRVVHLDAQQPVLRFGGGFTRYLDLAFEKMPNRDWTLHDEYRAHFGPGITIDIAPLSISGVVFTGPRLTDSLGTVFRWDVGLKASMQLWLRSPLHIRSEVRWTPLSSPDDQGIWSNLAALASGRLSLIAGAESPARNPLRFRALGGATYAF